MNMTFEYDPTPEPDQPLLKPGATRIWVIRGRHEVGATVQVAESIAMTDDDGNGFIEVGEFHEATVVDTTPPAQPGS